MSGILSYRRWTYSSQVSYSSNSTSYADAVSVSFEVRKGGGVLWALLPINCSGGAGEISVTYNSGLITNFGAFVKVLRDSTTLLEVNKQLAILNTAGLKASINPTAFQGFDPCVPGNYTFKLQFKSPLSGMTVAASGFRLFIAEAR